MKHFPPPTNAIAVVDSCLWSFSKRSCQEAWVRGDLLEWAGHWHQKRNFKLFCFKLKQTNNTTYSPCTSRQALSVVAGLCNTLTTFQGNIAFALALKWNCPYFSESWPHFWPLLDCHMLLHCILPHPCCPRMPCTPPNFHVHNPIPNSGGGGELWKRHRPISAWQIEASSFSWLDLHVAMLFVS